MSMCRAPASTVMVLASILRMRFIFIRRRVPPSAAAQGAVEWLEPAARTRRIFRRVLHDGDNIIHRICIDDDSRMRDEIAEPVGHFEVCHSPLPSRAPHPAGLGYGS